VWVVASQVTEFKRSVPILSAVCNKHLTERHWDAMEEVAGFVVRPDAGTTLQRLIDLGIGEFLDALESISAMASQEASIEEVLDKMEDEWEPVSFLCKPYKETGTHILQGAAIDECQTLLDDHIIKASKAAFPLNLTENGRRSTEN